MNKRSLTLYRWRKKILVLCAALPLLQTTGTCDIASINGAFGSYVGSNMLWSIFSTLVRSTTSTLINFYPGANILNTLLGTNPTPLFTG